MDPYRTAPPSIACPRCGEALEEVSADVLRCVACAGLWVDRALLDRTGAQWQRGTSAWWRAELRCPQAHLKPQLLTPRTAAGFTIDVCPEHGAWFDRGELAQLLSRPDDDDLDALRAVIGHWAPAADDPESLARDLRSARADLARLQARIAELEAKLAGSR
ncbi:MAG TPA: zf-TFIIB domain-containing protein [Kofleriaceae bacterium]|jgi:Zn-finger nucleic acid-binding protein